MSSVIGGIEYWPVERLIIYDKNARTHDEKQISQIAGSIVEFGFINPILVGDDNVIIAGHGRLLAAKQLDYNEVPVIVLKHLSREQQRALIIADNKIAENAGWDNEILKLELSYLESCDFDLDSTGFDDDEINKILFELDVIEDKKTETETETEDDLVNILESSTTNKNEDIVSRSGDIWILGNHRLLCGDSTDKSNVDILFNGKKADITVTDPPYNVDYDIRRVCRKDKLIKLKTSDRGRLGKITNDNMQADDFERFIRMSCENILDVTSGACYIFMSNKEMELLKSQFVKCGGKYSSVIIWVKNHFVLSRGDYHHQYEPIFYGWKKDRYWSGSRDQSDVWFFNKPNSNKSHPTMKPVELIQKAIRNSSKINDVVYDPFAGSGSTLIACEYLDRIGYLIEIDPKYVDVIIRRWEKVSGNNAVLESTGQTFKNVAASVRDSVPLELDCSMNDFDNVVKRRRGRPKKVVDVDSYDVDEDSYDNEESVVKRKRGRPKKVVDEDSYDNEESAVKRKRGRPKKVVDEDSYDNEESVVKRKRGRPKKVVDVDFNDDEESVVKRKRGRPKKVVDEDSYDNEESVVKRKRGRPKKVVDVDFHDNEESVVKRKRGRPKKVVDVDSYDVDEDSYDNDEPVVKRKRGRPKKVVDEDSYDNEESVVKRKRGRPKKVVDIDFHDNDEPVVKRKRGRPKKVVDVDSYDVDEDSYDNEESAVKRKRGRPKKVVDVDFHDNDEPVVKRKRGRPKKVVDEDSYDNEESAVKRKRGRPKKVINVDFHDNEESVVKRKRGRPKKVVDVDFNDNEDQLSKPSYKINV